MTVIQPYLERFVLGEKKQWSEVVVEASREMALAALSLPGELQRFMDRALRGDLELRVRNLEDNARLLYTAGSSSLWGMLAAAAAGWRCCSTGAGSRSRPGWRGSRRALFGLFLVFTWLAGRPRRLAAATSDFLRRRRNI